MSVPKMTCFVTQAKAQIYSVYYNAGKAAHF